MLIVPCGNDVGNCIFFALVRLASGLFADVPHGLCPLPAETERALRLWRKSTVAMAAYRPTDIEAWLAVQTIDPAAGK